MIKAEVQTKYPRRIYVSVTMKNLEESRNFQEEWIKKRSGSLVMGPEDPRDFPKNVPFWGLIELSYAHDTKTNKNVEWELMGISWFCKETTLQIKIYELLEKKETIQDWHPTWVTNALSSTTSYHVYEQL